MKIKDSGARTEFETGAVRDIQEGKGRMDLLPARALYFMNATLPTRNWSYGPVSYRDSMNLGFDSLLQYMQNYENFPLAEACWYFLNAIELQWAEVVGGYICCKIPPTGLVEVAKIFEAGALKYEPRNWEKGIPLSRFLDSGLRHLCRAERKDDDEPHLTMGCWNLLCMLETKLRIDAGFLPAELNDAPVLLQEKNSE